MVFLISILPLISSSWVPFSKLLKIVPSAPTIIGITVLSRLPLFVSVCCICLLVDIKFHIYLHITYTCNSFPDYQFSLWYNWSFWDHFALPLKEIQFLMASSFKSFLIYPMSNLPSFSHEVYIQLLLLLLLHFKILHRLPISNSSHALSKSSGAFLNRPVTICIAVTLMLHSFLSSQARSKYLSLFSLSFIFLSWFIVTAKSTILQAPFFC